MNILEIIKLSIENLLNFKLRSFLTMLGIIIGIVSVVLISSLGAGFEKKMLADANTALNSVLDVTINEKYSGDQTKISEKEYITDEDIENISTLPLVKKAAPMINLEAMVVEEKTNTYTYPFIASKNSYEVMKPNILEGRYFTNEEMKTGANVILINKASAVSLLGPNPLGKEITLKFYDTEKITFTIIGLTKEIGEDISRSFGDRTVRATLTKKTAELISGQKYTKYKEILVNAKSEKDIKEAKEEVEQYLKTKSSKTDLYKIKPLKEETQQITGILQKISLFIMAIAAISIIVGGIGVMNIMLVSVKERITEIGLRKAIGAKNKQIIGQFIIETIILTIIGGLIGILFGFSLSLLIGLLLKILPVLKIKIVMSAFIVSTITGLIFGIYPAKQAAKLSPMEALRKE